MSGLQVQETWSQLSKLDDRFASALDYAFNERLGYLTSGLDEVGTGLRILVLLHLPGLTGSGRILALEKSVREKHHALDGLFGPISAAPGDFYALTNRVTLGRSEEEIAYNLRVMATELIAQERAAREHMLSENEYGVLDRVGRALGVARGARLLEFNEGLDVLSSIRMDVATQRLEAYPVRLINEVLVGSQPAHVARRIGDTADQVARSVARAEMFRKRFGKNS
jgi:protein arginine kinase